MTGEFTGFPSVGRATAIPNLFFATVLPRMRSPAALLAFLWVARFAQERRGGAAFVAAGELARDETVRASFAALAGSTEALGEGLGECVRLGALLAFVEGEGGGETYYGLNTPANRRALARAQAGGPVPAVVSSPLAAPRRPDVFRLYEEHIGTITPLVGERLLEAMERYPGEWIEDAFREAALRNVRNWRYVERILERWAEEGRAHEAVARDSFEARRRRYLGDARGASPRA